MLDNSQAGASGLEVYKKAAADLLPATEEFCKDAWHNKAKFAFHVGGEVVSAITFGATLGAIVPKGPAGFIVAAAFTVPMVVDAIKGVKPNRDEPEARMPAGPRVSVPLAPRPDPELA